MIESRPISRTRVSLKAFVLAALAVTFGDAADGVVFFWLTAGLNPIGVLQYIASGLLGRSAFSGGLGTATLGLGIHTFLSFGFTALLATALTLSDTLRKSWALTGFIWGALVWLFMNLVALPHSNVPPSPLTALAVVHGLIAHGIFVGVLPAYILTRERKAA